LPYSNRTKYKVKHNKKTAIYFTEDDDLIAETCRRFQAYVRRLISLGINE